MGLKTLAPLENLPADHQTSEQGGWDCSPDSLTSESSFQKATLILTSYYQKVKLGSNKCGACWSEYPSTSAVQALSSLRTGTSGLAFLTLSRNSCMEEESQCPLPLSGCWVLGQKEHRMQSLEAWVPAPLESRATLCMFQALSLSSHSIRTARGWMGGT